jgi:hypothetical protein
MASSAAALNQPEKFWLSSPWGVGVMLVGFAFAVFG